MDGNDQFIGIVQLGHLEILAPHRPPRGSVGLTRIQMQEARPPESAELDLTDHEGKAIMVRGHDGGDWIYSAEVIDQAGPILTVMVQQVFGEPSEAS